MLLSMQDSYIFFFINVITWYPQMNLHINKSLHQLTHKLTPELT